MHQTFLLITACIMTLLFIWYSYSLITTPIQTKKTFLLLALIPAFASLSYWGMYLGYGVLQLETGTVYLMRYFDWLVTTPILIFLLHSVAFGNTLPSNKGLVIAAVIFDIIMILTGIFATITTHWLRWFWFILSSVAFIATLWTIVGPAKSAVADDSVGKKSLFTSLSWLILVLWSFYPFGWLLGTNVWGFLDLETEILLYGILDIFAKGAFGALLIYNQKVISADSVRTAETKLSRNNQ